MVFEFNPNTNIIIQTQSVSNPTQSKIESTCPVENIETSIENSDASNAIANNSKPFIGQKFALNNVSSKKFLRNEILNLKDSDNNTLFDSSTVDEIIKSRNNNEELFKILNLLKSNNIVLDERSMKDILCSEKITSDEIEQKIELGNELKSNPIFSELKEEFGEEKLTDATLADYIDTNVEQMRKNVATLSTLKINAPNLYKKVLSENSYFNLRCILDAKIDKDVFTNILEAKLLDDTLSSSNLLNLLASKTPVENINKNIELLTYFRAHPRLQFLFKEDTGLRSWEISNILQRETSQTLDVNKKEGVINFVNELTHILTSQDIIEILLKDKNDLYEDGRELVKLALENKLENYQIFDLLKNNEFSQEVDRLKRITSNPIVFKEFGKMLLYLKNTKSEEFKNLINTLDYLIQKPELIDYIHAIYSTLNRIIVSDENEEKNILKDLFACKNMIDKSAEVFTSLPSDIANNAQYAILERLCDGKKLDFIEENVQFLNELFNDEILSEVIRMVPDKKITDFITKNADIKTLKRNIEELKALKKTGIWKHCDLGKIVLYECNLKKVLEKYNELLDKYGDDVSISINNDNKNVSFSFVDRESGVLETYNKDLKHLYTEVINQNDDGSSEIIITDKINKSQHTAIVQDFEEDYLSASNKLTSRYFDDNGNTIKTKFYNQSCSDGSVNIKELTPQGKLKTISGLRRTPLGTFIEKELTSCDGTKSYIKSFIDLYGNENYTYKIIDKDGKALLNHVRQSKNIDENTKITSVNGKVYKVFNTEDCIEVTDMDSGGKTIIDFNKIFACKREKSIEKMLKTLPGDELIKLCNHVKSICYSDSLTSAFNPFYKEIRSGTNKFVFLHELGHAKDLTKSMDYTDMYEKANITGNTELQRIFKEELASLKENESECIRKILNYFTAGSESHYAGELGGLSEVVAEVNAIQATSVAHPYLQMRTQLLQEYFPRTVAYLIKNYLAC